MNHKASTERRPRDDHGHFVPLECPVSGCDGKLVHEGDGIWQCNGLVDPDDENKQLEACRYAHFDGERYEKP